MVTHPLGRHSGEDPRSKEAAMVPTRFADSVDEMDWIFENMTQRVRGGIMPMDAFEKDDICTLRFDLAGVDPDDVDITVERGILTVTARRPAEETEGVNWLVRERPTGIHSREVRLGERLDVEHITADHGNGVLTVTIPVRPQAKRRKVPITAGSSAAPEQHAIDVDQDPSGGQ